MRAAVAGTYSSGLRPVLDSVPRWGLPLRRSFRLFHRWERTVEMVGVISLGALSPQMTSPCTEALAEKARAFTNCHRIIHRSDDPSDLASFKARLATLSLHISLPSSAASE